MFVTASIVIPAFNGRKFLAANLPSVLALKTDEVIVVDDASSDGSSDFISSHFPQIKLLVNCRNLRFPDSVNKGMAQATGEIIILLNQDVRPHPDLLQHVLPHFSSAEIFAITFNEQKHSWAKASLKNGWLEYTNGRLDERVHPSFWASGAGSAFRKSMWDQLGGFDNIFTPGYFEDLDLGFRAHKRGLEIIWDPKATVEHVSPESTFRSTFSALTLRYVKERNYLLVHWKNLDPINLKSHIYHLASRICRHPGYLIPTLLALVRLPAVMSFRRRERHFIKLNDSSVFAKFTQPSHLGGVMAK